MKNIVFTFFFLCVVNVARAQDETHNLSPLQAKTILQSLNYKIADTSRIDKLLRLALYNILKPGENKADLDSAANFVNNAETIAKLQKIAAIDGYIAWVKSNLYREKGLKDQGKKFAESAVALLASTPDKYHLGAAYLELSHYYEYSNPKEVGEKMRLVELAVKALDLSNAIELRAYTRQFLADLYSTQSKDVEGLPIIKRAIADYQSINYKKLQGAYHVYSSLYYDLSDYENALNYEFKALKVAEELKDTVMIGSVYNGLGMIYDSIKDRVNAKKHYMLALANARQRRDIRAMGYVLQNIVVDYDFLNQNKEALDFINKLPERDTILNLKVGSVVPFMLLVIYSKLNQPGKAEFYMAKLQKYIDENHPAPLRISRIYARFVTYYMNTRQFQKAKYYLEKSDSVARSIPDNFAVTWDYFARSRLDSVQGNYKAALYNLSRFNVLHDSLLNETKNRQLKQLQVIYETEKKENDIKIRDQNIRLLNQKSEFQQVKLQHAQNTRNWITAGSVMVLIIAGLLYRQNMLRKKNNKVVTHKNELLQHLLTEKEWLLKEVHHRVKNNLHTVICLLESQAIYLENDALKAIESSQHRIYAMSLIHQKLYQSDDIKTIDMAAYIPELVQSLQDGFGVSAQVKFIVNVAAIHLNISQAIPLGLIINEAVTNSIKYAFPDNRKGEILITMIDKEEYLELELADNGIGMAQIDHDIEPESLGLKLIKGLCEDIDAKITIESDKGTTIIIKFNPDHINNPGNFPVSSKITEVYP